MGPELLESASVEFSYNSIFFLRFLNHHLVKFTRAQLEFSDSSSQFCALKELQLSGTNPDNSFYYFFTECDPECETCTAASTCVTCRAGGYTQDISGQCQARK